MRYPERERRFLGCVRIPLSAVYQTQVLDGTFRLEVGGTCARACVCERERSGETTCVCVCV